MQQKKARKLVAAQRTNELVVAGDTGLAHAVATERGRPCEAVAALLLHVRSLPRPAERRE